MAAQEAEPASAPAGSRSQHQSEHPSQRRSGIQSHNPQRNHLRPRQSRNPGLHLLARPRLHRPRCTLSALASMTHMRRPSAVRRSLLPQSNFSNYSPSTPPSGSSYSRIKRDQFCLFSLCGSIECSKMSHTPDLVTVWQQRRFDTKKAAAAPLRGLQPLTDQFSVSVRPTHSVPVRRDGSERDPPACRWGRRSWSCRSRAESTGWTGYRPSPGNPRRCPRDDPTA